MKTTSTGFVPTEDTGHMFVDIAMPPATSAEKTLEIARQVDEIIKDWIIFES